MEEEEITETKKEELIFDCCDAHLLLHSNTEPTVDSVPRIIHIRKDKTSIGRDRNSVDVYLDSSRYPRMISRVHAYIIYSNNQWYIRDNRSVNGVFLNDVKIHESRIKLGDVITFGGGGNMMRGSIKRQDMSEFNYIFIEYSSSRNKNNNNNGDNIDKNENNDNDNEKNEESSPENGRKRGLSSVEDNKMDLEANVNSETIIKKPKRY